MNALVKEGYRRAQAVTRAHAKSFYFASFLLFGARRRAAFALYAVCRRLDDLVDGDGEADALGAGARQASSYQVAAAPVATDELRLRLERARAAVGALYADAPDLAAPSYREQLSDSVRKAAHPWHPAELAALADTIARFRIPEAPFQELISGMEMDLTLARYITFEQLDRYCYRVAGVVGLMLTPVLGYDDASALPAAADLGRAMQLTNILRDVKEDLARGRIYLPDEELAAFGLAEKDLQRGVVDERFRDFMRAQVARARAYYQRAAVGIGYLKGFGAQRMVRLMGGIYGGILESIEARDYDVFSGRAFVPTRRKLWLALRTLFAPRNVLPALEGSHDDPLLPSAQVPSSASARRLPSVAEARP